jgi:hypothetical protein
MKWSTVAVIYLVVAVTAIAVEEAFKRIEKRFK